MGSVVMRKAPGADSRRPKVTTSVLPPEMMMPTRLPATSSLPDRTAAAARAPVGSTTIFIRSARNRIVSTSSASDTVTMSATSRRISAKVNRAERGRLRTVGQRPGDGDCDDLAFAERLLRIIPGLGLDADDLMPLDSACAARPNRW